MINKLKTFVRLSSLLVIVPISLYSCNDSKNIDIRIINTTDVHGNILPMDEINDKPASGGYSRFSSFLKEAREQSPNLLLLDNGDLLQGEPITYYSNYIDTANINVVAKAMNLLKYSEATVGNHDIEPGLSVFNKWRKECNFPVLGANIIDVKNNKPYVQPYAVFDVNGAKVAVIGVVTPAIPQWVPEDRWKGLRFDNIKETLEKWVPIVKEKEKPDLLVVSMHSGFKGNNPDYIEDAGEQVAKEVGGIDLILTGHDHQKYMQWVKRSDKDSVLVMNPSNHLDYASDIHISIQKQGDKVVSKKITADFVDINKYPIDDKFVSEFTSEAKALEDFLDKSVGALQSTIKGENALFGSSSYMTLIHNMQLYTMKADISFAAPLSTSSIIKAGDVKVKDLFKFCPFTNYLYVMELTGKQIQGYLEYSYRGWANTMTSDSSNLILLRDGFKMSDKFKTKVPTFNYSSAQGIDYTVNVAKSPVEVYISQMSDGSPFDMNKTYKVVMTSYRAGGAGGLLTDGAGIPKGELKSRIVAVSADDQLYNMMKYFEVKGVIKGENANNWQFIPTKWAEQGAKKDRAILFPSN